MNDTEDITLYKIVFKNVTMNKRFLKRNSSILSTINEFLEKHEGTQTMNDNDILKKIEELELQIKDLKQVLNEKETFPKKGVTYYFVNANCTIVDNIWNEDDIECELLYSNNLFKTRERAEEVAEKIKLLLLLERGHDEYCPDFKPCFEGPDLHKNYVVYYDYASHKWRYDYFSKITNKHDVYFDSEESAQKMCNVLNDE